MKRLGCAVLALALLAQAAPGQTGERQTVRQRLETRGLPADLAADVAAVVDAAVAVGLPADPLVSKAIEGWSKRVSAGRIVAAVRDLSSRLAAGRDALRGAGLDASSAALIAASAEALGRGVSREDVVAVVRAAPAVEAAQVGLVVAASLSAQGLDRALAVRVVVESLRRGSTAEQILDLPAAARTLLQRGMRPSDVGRDLLEGIGRGGAAASGRGAGTVRPPVVPPAPGTPGGKRP